MMFSFLDRDEFDDELEAGSSVSIVNPALTSNSTPPPESTEAVAPTDEPTDTGQTVEILPEPLEAPASKSPAEPSSQKDQQVPQSQAIAPRQPFRQKFQRWPNQPPRWNPMAPQHQQQMPFQRQSGPVMRQPSHMMQGGPGPQQRPMRPGFPPQNRPNFFNNNFMHSRPPIRPPMVRQRFFYQNAVPGGDPSMQGGPGYAPTPVVPALPRKVLINPNFKGGVEAAKSEF